MKSSRDTGDVNQPGPTKGQITFIYIMIIVFLAAGSAFAVYKLWKTVRILLQRVPGALSDGW